MHFIGLNAEKKGKIAVTSVGSGILKSVHAGEYVCWKIKRDGFNEYLVSVTVHTGIQERGDEDVNKQGI